MDDMRKWMSKGGGKFLKDIGIKSGQSVLDFGCGVGNSIIICITLSTDSFISPKLSPMS